MNERVHFHSRLILSPGTQVVTLQEIVGVDGAIVHPRGAVGVVVKSPADAQGSYRVRFLDGFEALVPTNQTALLAKFKEGELGEGAAADAGDLYDRVFFRCIVGSRAYGLAEADSDVDRRGAYLAPADRHWSLYGVPEQLERHDTQETYWELQKFLVLALKANPNVLECLYTPLVEQATPLAQELLALRDCFLSRMVYQTFSGYVASQFKKIEADVRNRGAVKWKHVMHLVRLLHSGIGVLRERTIQVHVGAQRERLLAIRRGEVPWEDVAVWRLELHREFDAAYQGTKLPERPDYRRVNALLIDARRRALTEELP